MSPSALKYFYIGTFGNHTEAAFLMGHLKSPLGGGSIPLVFVQEGNRFLKLNRVGDRHKIFSSFSVMNVIENRTKSLLLVPPLKNKALFYKFCNNSHVIKRIQLEIN